MLDDNSFECLKRQKNILILILKLENVFMAFQFFMLLILIFIETFSVTFSSKIESDYDEQEEHKNNVCRNVVTTVH